MKKVLRILIALVLITLIALIISYLRKTHPVEFEDPSIVEEMVLLQEQLKIPTLISNDEYDDESERKVIIFLGDSISSHFSERRRIEDGRIAWKDDGEEGYNTGVGGYLARRFLKESSSHIVRNYAVAGAKIENMKEALVHALEYEHSKGRSVSDVVLWGGHNDYIHSIESNSPENIARIASVMDEIMKITEREGARFHLIGLLKFKAPYLKIRGTQDIGYETADKIHSIMPIDIPSPSCLIDTEKFLEDEINIAGEKKFGKKVMEQYKKDTKYPENLLHPSLESNKKVADYLFLELNKRIY